MKLTAPGTRISPIRNPSLAASRADELVAEFAGVFDRTVYPDGYLDELASVYDFDSLRRFRVVVDCCNGTSALILRRLNERFGFGFILISSIIRLE